MCHTVLVRVYRRMGRQLCLATVDAAANLSLQWGVRWRTGRPDRSVTPDELAARLAACLRTGEVFELPENVAGRVPLHFAIPETAFPLALLYIWALLPLARDRDDQRPPSGDVIADRAVRYLAWNLSTRRSRDRHLLRVGLTGLLNPA